MQIFDISTISSDADKRAQAWLEFLRGPSLSMGVYRLKGGQVDSQRPPAEDEVYYVVSGRASFRAGEQVQTVGPGHLIFVEKSLEHRFSDVTEDLRLLVFFAPPEGSGAEIPRSQ